jgi:integrator complex subunit 7
VPGEAITTTIGSQLAVKVEGIVQVTSSLRYSGRRVRAVQVSIQSNPANPTVGSDGKVYLLVYSIFILTAIANLFLLAD